MSYTRTLLDHELRAIRDDILRMGSLTEEQTTRAVQSLKNRDLKLAHQVVADDERINALRYKVEDECLRVIATQQPAARDLRTVIAAMHMAVEMERIADHASGIANISIRMGDGPLIKPLIDIPRMQVAVNAMLHEALDAYIKLNADLAGAVIEKDNEVDALYSQILRELLTYMMQDARTISGATYLLWIAHNLERIGDRVTNLCERVIFAATGELGDYKPLKNSLC
jgi:phosphate transport system protein